MKKKYIKLAGLSKLNTGIKAYKIIGYDIETTGSANDFLIAGFMDEGGYKSTAYQDKAIWQLRRYRPKDTRIYATNAEFDVVGACWNTKYFYDLETSGSKAKTTQHKLGHDRKSVKIYDTLNHAKMGVKEMGEYIGKPKLKQPKAFGREPKNEAEWDEMLEYNKRDCEITKEFMEQFQTKINSFGGNLCSTISACSMDIYRRKYMDSSIIKEFPTKSDTFRDRINVLIRKAYYGGRTECFGRGLIENYNLYDVNSLYPAMMLKSYPKPISAKYATYPAAELKLIEKYEGVSQVIIETPKSMKYPLLAVRKGDKLLFPLGRFKGCYTHLELRRATELGYNIRKILKTVYYEENFKPFKSFVIALYKARMEAKQKNDAMMNITAKLLLNSLYGKWGQTIGESAAYCRHYNEIKRFKGRKEVFPCWRSFEKEGKPDYYKVVKIGKKPKHYIPIFSAYISSYGRIMMHNLIMKYEGIYMDTDSIITKKNIPTGDNIGELKLEKKIKRGIIIRPKFYMLETADRQFIKIKGVTKADIKAFNHILSGKTVRRKRFLKLKEALVRKEKPNKVVTVIKKMGLEDDKRLWPGKFNPLEYQESQPLRI